MNKINIIIFEKKSVRFFNFTISKIVFYFIIIAFLFSIISTIYFVFFNSRYLLAKQKISVLAIENKKLKEDLTIVKSQLDTLNSKLKELAELDAQIRIAANLELMPKDLRAMGYGGASENELLASVDNLIERAKLQEKSFRELKRFLEQQTQLINHTPSIWPVAGFISSGFGYRKSPISNRKEFHEGLDIVAPAGTPIRATADGRVRSAGYKPGWGRYIEIDHGFGYITFYAHCQTIKVRVGDKVRRGDIIATVGKTGSATGNHLHYGIKVADNWVNPLNYIVTESALP